MKEGLVRLPTVLPCRDQVPRLSRAFFAAALLGFTAVAHGKMSVAEIPLPIEIEELPQYCKVQRFMWESLSAAQKNDLSLQREKLSGQWAKVFGESNYIHVHHYCWGLVQLKRASQSDDGDPTYSMHRRTNLRSAIDNFDYILRRVDRSFVLRPEILLNKARAQIELNDLESAKNALVEAVTAKQDYVEAYLELSNVFMRIGDRAEAVRILQVGRQIAPNSQEIENRLYKMVDGVNK